MVHTTDIAAEIAATLGNRAVQPSSIQPQRLIKGRT